MCEQSIIGARASVMVYDDTQKKWIPSGTSSGLSKVQIYHHQQNNTFRVVGRKLQDHEVVINCSISKGLKYNQATATFHQWRDSKFVYGLNFSSQQDAEGFARAMMHALEVLSGRLITAGNPPLPNGTTYDEDMGYRTMTREDAAMIQQQQITTAPPAPHTPTSQTNQNIPQSPPTPQGHHRTSSAPPAPQPPPMSMPPQGFGSQTGMLPIQPQYNQMHQQQTPPQQHVYATQSSYGSNQNMSQYNQPIYVSSSSNQNQIQPPSMHPQTHNSNSPIYVSTNQQPPGLPNSVSNNSVYTSQQQSQQIQPPPVVYAPSNGLPNNSNYPTPAQISATIPQAPPFPSAMNNGPPNPPAIPAPPMIAMGPIGGSVPPPPPPPMGGLLNQSVGMDMSSLASQLQQAKLKRNAKNSPPPLPAENSGSSTSSGGSGNYGTIGRSSNGMASMMDEMAKTLARRREKAEKKPEPEQNDDNGRQRPWEKSNTLPHKLGTNSGSNSQSNNMNNSGSESPRPSRKRFGSASEETILKQVNGDGSLSLANPQELDNFRTEIIREMRIEINKAKQEILDAIKIEFNRRSGIYKVTCRSCNKVYVGQTRRAAMERFKEHKRCIKFNRPQKSAVAAHVWGDKNKIHEIGDNNLHLEKQVRKRTHLDAWEAIYMKKYKDVLMNIDPPNISSCLFNMIKL